jgi:hypothetical protein
LTPPRYSAKPEASTVAKTLDFPSPLDDRIAEFARSVDLYLGQYWAPESALPCPKQELFELLRTTRQPTHRADPAYVWLTDLMVDLTLFVPDADLQAAEPFMTSGGGISGRAIDEKALAHERERVYTLFTAHAGCEFDSHLRHDISHWHVRISSAGDRFERALHAGSSRDPGLAPVNRVDGAQAVAVVEDKHLRVVELTASVDPAQHEHDAAERLLAVRAGRWHGPRADDLRRIGRDGIPAGHVEDALAVAVAHGAHPVEVTRPSQADDLLEVAPRLLDRWDRPGGRPTRGAGRDRQDEDERDAKAGHGVT